MRLLNINNFEFVNFRFYYVPMNPTEPDITKFFDENYKLFIDSIIQTEKTLYKEREYRIPNNQLVDRVLLDKDKKIQSLIECKGTVGTSEFIKGIGQAYQGYHQKILNLDENFNQDALSYLLVPIEITNSIDVQKFDYTNVILVFADLENQQFLKSVDSGDLTSEWVSISPYYFRDASLYGIYFYLRFVSKQSGELEKLNKGDIEKTIQKFRKLDLEWDIGDVRNNGIVMSKLGFYDDSDLSLTALGYEFSKLNFHDFCKRVVLDILGDYSRIVFLSIQDLMKSSERDGEFFYIKTEEIKNQIVDKYFDGKKVNYLMDPDGKNRNLLTIMRMLEVIGSIEREGNKIKINYPPFYGLPFLMKKYNPNYLEPLKEEFDYFNLPY